jgi:hypothetical protein
VQFREQRRDPEVSIAGEKLIWEQVDELCRRDGLIWKEKWQTRVWTGGKYAFRSQTHEYGNSILYPDTAYKNEAYTYVNVNPTLRTADAEKIKKDKAVQRANAEVLKQLRQGKLRMLNPPVPEEEILAVLDGAKSVAEVLVDNATPEQLRKFFHDLRKKAEQTDDPDNRRWARALKASGIDPNESGIFALTHFPRSTDWVYKIAEATDTKATIWGKLNDRVLSLVKDRVAKNRNGKALWEGDDLRELYHLYASHLILYPWRTRGRVPVRTDPFSVVCAKLSTAKVMQMLNPF